MWLGNRSATLAGAGDAVHAVRAKYGKGFGQVPPSSGWQALEKQLPCPLRTLSTDMRIYGMWAPSLTAWIHCLRCATTPQHQRQCNNVFRLPNLTDCCDFAYWHGVHLSPSRARRRLRVGATDGTLASEVMIDSRRARLLRALHKLLLGPALMAHVDRLRLQSYAVIAVMFLAHVISYCTITQLIKQEHT